MKPLLPVAILLLLTSCAHTRYYAPVLMERTDENKPTAYSAIFSTGILVPRSKEGAEKQVLLSVESIHPGFLHRGKGIKEHWSKRETANAWKDKDLWVLVETEGLEGNDIFEAKVDRKTVFSHVVLNAGSFDAITTDIRPIPLILNKVHRIKAKVYSIDKFLLKKALFETKDKSVGKWVTDSVTGLGRVIGNVFAKEALDYYKIVTDQNYTLEQLLITAGSNLEFYGSFDLVPADGVDLTKKHIALYDRIKSEQDPEWEQSQKPPFNYTPTGVSAYHGVYEFVKGTATELPDRIRPSEPNEIKKSFVKFAIQLADPNKPEDKIKLMNF